MCLKNLGCLRDSENFPARHGMISGEASNLSKQGKVCWYEDSFELAGPSVLGTPMMLPLLGYSSTQGWSKI